MMDLEEVQTVNKKNLMREKLEDILVCPNCGKPLIRVGCHAICKQCGYQEGCGD